GQVDADLVETRLQDTIGQRGELRGSLAELQRGLAQRTVDHRYAVERNLHAAGELRHVKRELAIAGGGRIVVELDAERAGAVAARVAVARQVQFHRRRFAAVLVHQRALVEALYAVAGGPRTDIHQHVEREQEGECGYGQPRHVPPRHRRECL